VARTLAAIDVNGLARHEARRFQIEDRVHDLRDPTGRGVPDGGRILTASDDKTEPPARPVSGIRSGRHPTSDILKHVPEIRVRSQAHGSICVQAAGRAVKQNPPHEADTPILARLARIGLVPGQDFDMSKLASVPNIQEVPKLGIERIVAHYPAGGADVNGWVIFRPTGVYGTDYLQRALITRYGLGANIEQDAVYPIVKVDSTGRTLNGANKYFIRFPKGQMPPVRGFWSLTMYDAQYFFVANPLNRYTLSARNKLKAEPDGAVELLIQARIAWN
jgi:hypothetical protein